MGVGDGGHNDTWLIPVQQKRDRLFSSTFTYIYLISCLATNSFRSNGDDQMARDGRNQVATMNITLPNGNSTPLEHKLAATCMCLGSTINPMNRINIR